METLREIFEIPRDFMAWIAYRVFHLFSEPEELDSVSLGFLFDPEEEDED